MERIPQPVAGKQILSFGVVRAQFGWLGHQGPALEGVRMNPGAEKGGVGCPS
jgi:hypothetical protein